jgi:hypothetical protein
VVEDVVKPRDEQEFDNELTELIDEQNDEV